MVRTEKMLRFPSNQHLWATYYDAKGKPKWAICSDAARIKWFLYFFGENGDGKPRKVKTGKSPKDFEEEVGRL